MPKDRPLTQREIRAAKVARESASDPASSKDFVWITNISKQSIPIQLMAPLLEGGKGKRMDPLKGEQTINLTRGESQRFPANRLMMHQLENLQKTRRIRVVKS